MTMPQRGNSMELEPSQIKFLPSPDGSFPEAIYEFSVFVKIVEKVDGHVFSWRFPPELPPAAISFFEQIPFYARFSHTVIEYLEEILNQIGLEIISYKKCESGGYMLRVSSSATTLNKRDFYRIIGCPN